MNQFFGSTWGGVVAAALIVIGVSAALAIQISDQNAPMKGKWKQYEDYLDGMARFLFLAQRGRSIARVQAAAVAAFLVLGAIAGETLLLVLAVLIAVAVPMMLKRRVRQRTEKLEQQLDGWLLMLANALKATPAIGEAIKSTVNLVQPPISQELDLMVKENQLGTPVDQAVLNISERVGSPLISGALATLIIARQTGGDLPKILETSAGSLREMARLEGVVRAKTSEGKGQVIVLGVIPFLMVGLLGSIDPTWLTPLTSNFIGYIIVTVAVTLWLGAMLWSRQILDVDI
ncbi:MAG: hypothetical protein GXP55_00945 [Deltaproteobacteria bacterium]|nr:hypothetical protein [Deltaproteobacteria bacterium]